MNQGFEVLDEDMVFVRIEIACDLRLEIFVVIIILYSILVPERGSRIPVVEV